MLPKHVKMPGPEVALNHTEETDTIHSYAQEWVQASVHKSTYKLLNDALPKLRKIIPKAMDSINPETL